MPTYIALIRKDKATSYGVDFPDLPGLVSGGETLEDAMRNAHEALAFHIEGLIEDAAAIPEPRPLDAIMRQPGTRGAVAVLVDSPIKKGKAVRVNLTFDENLLVRIDEAARDDGMGRSGWLATLARQRLEGRITPAVKRRVSISARRRRSSENETSAVSGTGPAKLRNKQSRHRKDINP